MSIKEQLRIDEGLRLTPYQDTRGAWTVGYGHKMTNPIPLSAAESILESDISVAEQLLMRTLPWTMQITSAARWEAFVNLTFNMGIGGVLSFTNMLTAARRNDWESASKELLNSLYAKQVGARAERIAKQLKEG